jgi:mannonate dehydratase
MLRTIARTFAPRESNSRAVAPPACPVTPITANIQHLQFAPLIDSPTAPGRGDAVYTTFKLENDWKNLPVGIAGPVSYNEYWERIEKFLKRVIPVCAEYKVAMANHPYDPPGLPYGYEGVENYDSPSIYTAYKKYEQMVDSP